MDLYGSEDFNDPTKPGQYISATLIERYVVTHNDVVGFCSARQTITKYWTRATAGILHCCYKYKLRF